MALAEPYSASYRGRGEYRLGTGGIAAPVHGPGGLVVGATDDSELVEELMAGAEVQGHAAAQPQQAPAP